MSNPTKAERKASLELKKVAGKIGSMLKSITGKRMCFSLVVFNEEYGSRMQYISNAERKSCIVAYESLLDCWKKGMPDVPAHEVDSGNADSFSLVAAKQEAEKIHELNALRTIAVSLAGLVFYGELAQSPAASNIKELLKKHGYEVKSEDDLLAMMKGITGE